MPMSHEAKQQGNDSIGQGSWSVVPRTPSRPQSARSAPSRPQSAPHGGRRPVAETSPVVPLHRPGPAGGSRPQSAASNGRRLLPAELGLAAHRVLTLPSHVDTCDKGDHCCWRWLAHAVLKEASWLREDMSAARLEIERTQHERSKVEHDAEAFAELRGAHAQVQQELSDLRVESVSLRQDLMKLGTSFAQKLAREGELERELAQAVAARKQALEKEAAAVKAADEATHSMNKAVYAEEYLKRELLRMEDERTKIMHELRETKKDRDVLKKVADDVAKRTKATKRETRERVRGAGFKRETRTVSPSRRHV